MEMLKNYNKNKECTTHARGSCCIVDNTECFTTGLPNRP